MHSIKKQYLEKFEKAYNELNTQQKKAVDTIEGPVMVVAGPGTGKTQLLAVRAGNILINTDTNPQNILCLTYTDAGTIAMRNRLLEFIGPEAHNVQICTFHSFCNMVIKDNPDAFGSFRDLQVVSDLERVQILREIIEGLPDDHLLRRFKGDIYTDRKRLENLFNLMKQENWTVDFIRRKVEERNALINDKNHPENPYIYQKKTTRDNITYLPGDLKIIDVEKEAEKNNKLLAAAELLEKYAEALKKKERFDYADMILWVIEKFRSDDYLLGKYQEKYQYIMVDEYQDTNGAQNELLFLLSSYWESPNLFIVGDDDQSIFRFQGANMNSIIDFREKFHPEEVVLTDNFRSSQIILDTSKTLIENNNERLVKKYKNLTKDLKEKRPARAEEPVAPQFIEYINPTQEEAGIIRKIHELAAQNVPYRDIAVIYTKNAHGNNLIQYFMAQNIPVNVKKKVNILNETEIEKLINLLSYLSEELEKPFSADYRLFEIMHYEYFNIHARDAALLSLHRAKKLSKSYADEDENEKFENIFFRRWIANRTVLEAAGVQQTETFLQLSSLLEQWIGDIPNYTVQSFIEKIITESGILDSALRSPESRWKLQLLNSFFDFVKSEISRKQNLKLRELIETIELMKESQLEIPLYKIVSDNNGINFMTAHSSKGLEFEHVFIIKCNKDNWEEKKGNNYNFSFPPNLISESTQVSTEDDRRLFYVAMTRSKHYLYISYYKTDDQEKEKEKSKFISECIHDESQIQKIMVPEEEVLRYKAVLMRFKSGEAQLIDNAAVQKMLEDFKMSNTNLNKYLECPLSFYFETVLRVPVARSKTMGFGNAVHYALEKFVKDIKNSNPRSYGSIEKLLAFFRDGMEKYKGDFTEREFADYTTHGVNLLTEYYQHYEKTWLLPKDYELEFRVDSVHYEGVPLRGFIDKIEIFENHIAVVDYKTGKFDSKKLKKADPEKNEIGGDYWRQIVFYKILLDSQNRLPHKMKEGIMDFLEKDKDGKYQRRSVEVEADDIALVTGQLKDAYAKIIKRQFTPGCEKPECKWCNFVNKNMSLREMSAFVETDADNAYENAQENYEPLAGRD